MADTVADSNDTNEVTNITNTKEELLLTTTDNPYNPFTQWEAWYDFDVEKGYNTCAYLARVAVVSDELSETDYDLSVLDAYKQILELNITGRYITVTPTSFRDRTAEIVNS